MSKKHVFKLINKDGYFEIAGGLIKLNRSSYAISNTQNNEYELTISTPSANKDKFSQKKVVLTKAQIDHLELEKQGDKIVLLDGENPIKDTSQQNIVIGKDDIIGANRNDVIEYLGHGEKLSITRKNIDNASDFGLSVSYLDLDTFKTVCAFLDFLPPKKEYYFVLEKNPSGRTVGYVGYITQDRLGEDKIKHVTIGTDKTSDCDGTYNYIYDLNKLEGVSPLLLNDKVADNVLTTLEKYEKDNINPKVAENLADLLSDEGIAQNLLSLLEDSKLVDECMLQLFNDDEKAGSIKELLTNNMSMLNALMPLIKPAIQMIKPLACSGNGTSGQGEGTYSSDRQGRCGGYSNLKIVPVEKEGNNKGSNNVSEAEIRGDCVGAIARFSEFGYFFQDNDLYIRSHLTKESTMIPREFHFLRIVKDDDGNCKLALCNDLGNLFYEPKKYDKAYASLLPNHKFIDVNSVKGNIDFHKYHHTHTCESLFLLRKDQKQPGEGYHSAKVYDISIGKEIGSLIDEFAYYDDQKLHYINYHELKKSDCCYDNALSVKLNGGDSSLYIEHSTDHYDMTIHPIAINQNSDFFDYLAYHNIS